MVALWCKGDMTVVESHPDGKGSTEVTVADREKARCYNANHTRYLVGFCIVEVNGNPIPTRILDKWIVLQKEGCLCQMVSACCSSVQGSRGPLHDMR